MILALVTGALTGFGCFALVRALIRPRPGVGALVARIDAGRRSMTGYTVTELQARRGLDQTARGLDETARGVHRRLGDRVEVLVAERGWRLYRTRTDLAMVSRPLGAHLASKLLAALGLVVVVPLAWGILRTYGIPLPGFFPAAVALVLALLGFFLPDLALRQEADRRRRQFRRSVGIFLDLVAMNLAGGRGLPEALLAASTISDHWTLIRIRQALANARLLDRTPWEALGGLGDELGIEELRDLSGALTLAADDGAKIRHSLGARAATLRRKELSEAEGQAGEQSQSMLVAQLLICSAFLVFLAFPAVSMLLTGGTTAGVGR
jgi:tight adherence protein C